MSDEWHKEVMSDEWTYTTFVDYSSLITRYSSLIYRG
jgi:hypothetical protein